MVDNNQKGDKNNNNNNNRVINSIYRSPSMMAFWDDLYRQMFQLLRNIKFLTFFLVHITIIFNINFFNDFSFTTIIAKLWLIKDKQVNLVPEF